MIYPIQQRTYIKANELGVKIYPSKNPKYKIDVYDYNCNFITHIGDAKFFDYPTYLEMEKNGKVPHGYADKRRDLYWTRHINEVEKLGPNWEGSSSYYSFALLWS